MDTRRGASESVIYAYASAVTLIRLCPCSIEAVLEDTLLNPPGVLSLSYVQTANIDQGPPLKYMKGNEVQSIVS